MGIKLSTNGGLTFSQKQGKTKQEQSALLEKLKKLDINKLILEQLAKATEEKKQAAEARKKERKNI